MTGKQKCEYLKFIRDLIAEKNNINYHSQECGFSGECLGTCPKCEEELKYLSDKIEEKKSKGESIVLDEYDEICLNSTDYDEVHKPPLIMTMGSIIGDYLEYIEEQQSNDR
ncbi:MAG: hypothetical protein ACI4WH_00605 [Oscillospiraceae bacterium]